MCLALFCLISMTLAVCRGIIHTISSDASMPKGMFSADEVKLLSMVSHLLFVWQNYKAVIFCSLGMKRGLNSSQICNPSDPSKAKCHQIKTCGDCTRAHPIGCMWCQSQNRCIDSEAYFTNFPYGQCLEWINTQTCSGEPY